MGTNIALFLLICSILGQVSHASHARWRNPDPADPDEFDEPEPEVHTSSTMTTQQVEKLMDDSVASKQVVMFSTTWCQLCYDTKDVLAKYNIPPEQFMAWWVNAEPKKDQVKAHLKIIAPPGNTVPRIFVNGKFIDKNFVNLHKAGKLTALLNKH